MKTIVWFLLVIAAVFAAIPFMPLGTAVNLLQLKRFGFEAAYVEGNLWEGHMYEARLGKIALGDVSSKLTLEDLAKGRLRLDLEGSDETSRLKGGFSYGLGGAGIEGFNIGMPVMAGPPPIGGITMIADGLTVRFPGGECTDAKGEVRAYLSGALTFAGLSNEMSGPALCREGKLAFDMAGSTGREQLVVTALTARKFRVRAFLRPTDPRVGQMLLNKGFTRDLDGYVFEEERKL